MTHIPIRTISRSIPFIKLKFTGSKKIVPKEKICDHFTLIAIMNRQNFYLKTMIVQK